MNNPEDNYQISHDPNTPQKTVMFSDCEHPQKTHNTVLEDTWYYCDECRLYRRVERVE